MASSSLPNYNAHKVSHSTYCSAPNCSNSRGKNSGLSFFGFPKDHERCKKWIVNCRRRDLDKVDLNKIAGGKLQLCEDHFEAIEFMNPKEKGIPIPRKRLMPNAVPTIFSIPNPPPPVAIKRKLPSRSDAPLTNKRAKVGPATTSSVGTLPSSAKLPTLVADERTEANNIEVPVTPTKNKLRTLLKNKRSKISRLKTQLHTSKAKKVLSVDELVEASKPYLPKTAHMFFETQLRMCKKIGKQRKWSNDVKGFALSLYHSSPKCYKLLCKIFALPSMSTLQRVVRNVDFQPGISPAIVEVLRRKVNAMSPQERLCSLSFDEMCVKQALHYDKNRDVVVGYEDFGNVGDRISKPATQALTIMLRGITINWKQIIGYTFSHNAAKAHKMKPLLEGWLEVLEEIGLTVVVIVCDQGSTNRCLAEKVLKVTKNQPFITRFNRRIYVMYDVPHLMKSIRNNLKKYDFLNNGVLVMWTMFVKLFELEREASAGLRLAPKLKKSHVTLPAFSKLKVKLATQVFSHSVFAALTVYTTMGKLPPVAIHTTNFVKTIDQLFDCCNSSTVVDKKIHRRPISVNSLHIKCLKDGIKLFENLKVVGAKDETAPFVQGWVISLNALIGLWETLNTQYDLKFLLTRRLNQDCLENAFASIRQRGGYNDHPQCDKFQHSLKKCVTSSLLKPNEGANCEVDGDKFLLDISSLTELSKESPSTSTKEKSTVLQIVNNVAADDDKTDDLQINFAEEQAVVYVAGYISKAVLSKHDKCITCKQMFVNTNTALHSDDQVFLFLKDYKGGENGLIECLTIPSTNWATALKTYEKLTKKYLPKLVHLPGVRERLLDYLFAYHPPTWFSGCEDTLRRAMTLFVNIRIFAMITDKNQALAAENAEKRKQKKLKKLNKANS